MAEDTTTSETGASDPPLVVTDGNSNTTVLEDTPRARPGDPPLVITDGDSNTKVLEDDTTGAGAGATPFPADKPDPVSGGDPKLEDRDGNGVKDGFEDQVANGAEGGQVAPADDGAGSFGNTGAPRRDRGNGPNPDANGGPANGADANEFRDRNENGINDAFETLLDAEDEPPPPSGPAVDGNVGGQPGRDENGNLLPGAEGRVTLDDFNRINDRDGNGINDGLESPVDLDGDGREPVRVISVGDGPDDGLLLGDGSAVILQPEAPREPPVPFILTNPLGEGTPSPSAVDATPPGVQADVVEAPANPPPVAAAPGADVSPADQFPAQETSSATLDTFDTGTLPAAPLVAEAAVSAPLAPPVADFAAEQTGPETGVTAPYDDIASASEPVGVADPAYAGTDPGIATLNATDTFDSQAIAAATDRAAKESVDDGGSNLLERMFERVKDLLFDSGSSSASPVQLPVPPDGSSSELPTEAALTPNEPAPALAVDDPPQTDDPDLDDGL